MKGITKNQPYTTLYFYFFSYLFPFSKSADAKSTFMLIDPDNDLMAIMGLTRDACWGIP